MLPWVLVLSVGNVFTLPSTPFQANGSVYVSVHADEYVYAPLYESYARDLAAFDKEMNEIRTGLVKEYEEAKRVYLTKLVKVENRYGIEAKGVYSELRIGSYPDLSYQLDFARRHGRVSPSLPTDPTELSRYYDAFHTALDNLGPPPKKPLMDDFPFPLFMWTKYYANITSFMARHTAKVDAWISGSPGWYDEVFDVSPFGKNPRHLENVRTHITRVFMSWKGLFRRPLPSLSFFTRVYNTMYDGK